MQNMWFVRSDTSGQGHDKSKLMHRNLTMPRFPDWDLKLFHSIHTEIHKFYLFQYISLIGLPYFWMHNNTY